MKKIQGLSDIKVAVRGAGDLASGVAWRLHQCGFRVYLTEIEKPMAVRRKVAFCEAVYDGNTSVEGVTCVRVKTPAEVPTAWKAGHIPLLVDPDCQARHDIQPEVLVDAIIAKKNLGTTLDHAPLVIALGPGFEAGKDAHFVVETKRGHFLGRLLETGMAEADTGIPGSVQGFTTERVLRAPGDGILASQARIGDSVEKGETLGSVAGEPLKASISGALRGLIRPGIRVRKGLKIGDIDPRGRRENCFTISEKALAIAGGVLEGILRTFKG